MPFSRTGAGGRALFTPPVTLLIWVVKKIQEDKTTALVIAPNWSSYPGILYWHRCWSSVRCASQQYLQYCSTSYSTSRPSIPFEHPSIWQYGLYPETFQNRKLFARGCPDPSVVVEWVYPKEIYWPVEDLGWWCTVRGWCPLSAPLTSGLTFLAELINDKDLEYQTVAVYNSAI